MKVRIISFYFFLFSLCGASAASIKVFPGPTAIIKAVNSAKIHDTLLLQAGIYPEHDLVIRKCIVISGVEGAVIDAENKYQVFIIYADSVCLSGVEIRNTGRSGINDIAGIRVVNAKGVVIRNNKLVNNTFGIYFQNATYCIIEGNKIQSDFKDELNGGNGIHAWKSDHLTIRNNIVTGHRDGIYFEFVTESFIIKNISFNNARYGLHFMFSHNDKYSGNTFNDNGAGVAVMYSKGVTMEDNYFTHNWGDAAYGLLLKEITDSRILHNHFEHNTVGIYMESTTRVDVIRNSFENNGWAIRVQASCSSGNFTSNNFTGNSFDVATNGTMMLNKFSNNYWDKYEGYDMDRNGFGDVPYYPVSMYSVISEKIPQAMILYRSFFTDIMDRVEKAMPTMIPDQLKDDSPVMKKIAL
jgi:nitrous oxidase accessory protein